MISAAFIGDARHIGNVYAQNRRQQLENLASFAPEILTLPALTANPANSEPIQVLFSTWGMPHLTARELDLLPNLKAVFYAAGSVRNFARPLLERGITVVSAWGANAIPVAEFTHAQILLATKGYFHNARQYKSPQSRNTAYRGRGNFGATISLLGAGQIGRHLIRLLQPFNLRIKVYDPYLSPGEAEELGVSKVTLEAAFLGTTVVSNHLANVAGTVGLLRAEHFAAMEQYAVFINTGRGATVHEAGLIQVLQSRPDLFALLDVTNPEPPEAGSPLFSMPNVQLTSHIAGSLGDEMVRMADFMIEEFLAFLAGRPLRFAVTEAMLETMA